MGLDDILSIMYPDDFGPNIQIKYNKEGELVIYHWDVDKLGQQPTEQSLLDQIPQYQAAFDNKQVSINRRKEMPSEHELIVAMWEDVVEGRPEAKEALQIRRTAIKTKFPKV